MTQAQPSLRLALASRPGCIEIVRAALDGLALATGLDALARNDLATVVGEAAKNVMLHAYDGAEGPLEVEIAVSPDAIEAVVRDHGIGIRPRVGERTGPHNGLGMPIVHLLSRRVTYTNLHGGGTEVRMGSLSPGLSPLPPLSAVEDVVPEVPAGALAVDLAAGALPEAVLPRLLEALAIDARAGEQARKDLRGLTELIAARSRGEEDVRLLARPAGQGLELTLGPLGSALAAGLAAAPPDAFRPVDGEARTGRLLTLRIG